MIYSGETYKLTIEFSWKSYCPYVLPWNGTHYDPDNSVIHNGVAMEEDNYILQKSIVPYSDGLCGVALSELEDEVSTIDQVKLCAVDHADGCLARDDGGNIIEFQPNAIVPPQAAFSIPDSDDGALLRNVTTVDEGDFTGLNGTKVWLYFSNVTVGDVWLVTRCDLKAYTRTPCINVYYGSPKPLHVGQIHPREKWAWEAVRLTPYIGNFTSNFEVRLDWTDKHKVDVVGLVVNPGRSIDVHEGTLQSAIHCNYDVKSEIQDRDNQTVTLNPGEGIWMNFTLPAQTKPKRDFLLETFGKYEKFDSSGVVPNSGPTSEPRSIASLSYKCPSLWETQYIARLRKTCNNGTVLASVVGWSLYYLGNETMGLDGLKTFSQAPIECHTYSKYNAFGALNFGEAKFKTIYDHLPDNVFTDRPFVGNEPLLSTVGYVATDGLNSTCTASIVINSTDAKYAGTVIHSGMSAEQNGDHAYSDWLKGYIAAALSIEEARSRLFFDSFWQEFELALGVKRVLMASAASYWVPCTWGLSHDPDGWYYYVDTIIPIRAAFQEHWPLPWVQNCLSIADFWADGESGNVKFEIYTQKSGIEIGRNSSREFTDKLRWYHISMVATGIGTVLGALVGCPCPVGLIIGAIPLIQQYLNPQNLNISGPNVCATGQSIVTEGNTNYGTFLIYMRVKFYGTVGSGEKSYQFGVRQKAWYSSVDHLMGITVPLNSVGTNCTLGFTVNWLTSR